MTLSVLLWSPVSDLPYISSTRTSAMLRPITYRMHSYTYSCDLLHHNVDEWSNDQTTVTSVPLPSIYLLCPKFLMMRYLSARLAQQVCLYEPVPFVPVTFGWTDYLPF